MGSGGQFINGYSQRICLGVIDRLSNSASNGDKVNRLTLEQPASNPMIAAHLVAPRDVRENQCAATCATWSVSARCSSSRSCWSFATVLLTADNCLPRPQGDAVQFVQFHGEVGQPGQNFLLFEQIIAKSLVSHAREQQEQTADIGRGLLRPLDGTRRRGSSARGQTDELLLHTARWPPSGVFFRVPPPEQHRRNEEAIDFARTLENPIDAGIPISACQGNSSE